MVAGAVGLRVLVTLAVGIEQPQLAVSLLELGPFLFLFLNLCRGSPISTVGWIITGSGFIYPRELVNLRSRKGFYSLLVYSPATKRQAGSQSNSKGVLGKNIEASRLWSENKIMKFGM